MIVVRIELKSAVSAARNRELAAIVIANEGTGDTARGNYTAIATRVGGPTRRHYDGRVEGFPRKSRSVLELLRRALNAIHENGGLP
jgi:hypothetical protein